MVQRISNKLYQKIGKGDLVCMGRKKHVVWIEHKPKDVAYQDYMQTQITKVTKFKNPTKRPPGKTPRYDDESKMKD